MSNDKHRSLARRVGWLRRGRDAGFATGVKHAVTIDADILRLEAEGLLLRERSGPAGRAGSPRKDHRKTYTGFRTSPAGEVFLAATLATHGADFGPVSLVVGSHRGTRTKTERRERAASLATPRHVAAARAEARRDGVRQRLAAIAGMRDADLTASS